MENKSLEISHVKYRTHIELTIYEFRSLLENKNGELKQLQIYLSQLQVFSCITYAIYYMK